MKARARRKVKEFLAPSRRSKDYCFPDAAGNRRHASASSRSHEIITGSDG